MFITSAFDTTTIHAINTQSRYYTSSLYKTTGNLPVGENIIFWFGIVVVWC
jgi:hypothetical protein